MQNAISDTFVDVLCRRAQTQAEDTAYIFLDAGVEQARLTFGDLDRRARAIAARLQADTKAGDRALLLFPAGLDFITAFLGCLYANVVPVPVYPPRRGRDLTKFLAIVENCSARAAITTRTALGLVDTSGLEHPLARALRWMCCDEVSSELAAAYRPVPISPDELAFLQYTSGSTGMPKGVMVTHANLMQNERAIARAFEHSAETVFVGWLPLFHDMGLMGQILQPLYLGVPSVLMAPLTFVQRPFRWLDAITKYRATTSGAPNFAYELCVQRISDEQLVSLDLSSWDLAYNGSEPVRADTLERFVRRFAPVGFRRESFFPCYGMAEVTLFAAGGPKLEPFSVLQVDAAALDQNRVVPAAPEAASRPLVACGRSWTDHQIRIVDPESRTCCPPGRVGEIWLAGSSVARGYWNRPEETEGTFGARLASGGGPFLRTGDLGILIDGQLFVTGRLKDLIIIKGRNHYPQDIEYTVEQSHPALVSGGGAAFSIEVNGEERLVVVQEANPSHVDFDEPRIRKAIRGAVAKSHDVQVHDTVLVRPRSIPKTSSGKIQRRACRDRFLRGEFKVLSTTAIQA